MIRIPINVRSTAREANGALTDSGEMAPPNTRPAGTGDDTASDAGDRSEVPDPTAAPNGDAASQPPNGEPPASDPTVPPASQPIDMRADDPIADSMGEHKAGNRNAGNRVMNAAGEMDGPAGAGVTGGELTDPQDAEKAVQKNIDTRTEEQEMFRRQMEGEVGTQTKDLKPSPAHPEEGLPENPAGSENTGGADESAAEAADGADGANTTAASDLAAAAPASATASAGAVARAVDEGDDRFLRAVAELENFKRQAARRETETRERAARSVLEDLLPVLDNFERALDAAKNARDVESVRVGIEFIAQQLRDTLKSHGVEPIAAQGQKFDPLHHEALEEVGDSGQPEGTVIEEAQRGYSFKGQVLRPSRVRVAGK